VAKVVPSFLGSWQKVPPMAPVQMRLMVVLSW